MKQLLIKQILIVILALSLRVYSMDNNHPDQENARVIKSNLRNIEHKTTFISFSNQIENESSKDKRILEDHDIEYSDSLIIFIYVANGLYVINIIILLVLFCNKTLECQDCTWVVPVFCFVPLIPIVVVYLIYRNCHPYRINNHSTSRERPPQIVNDQNNMALSHQINNDYNTNRLNIISNDLNNKNELELANGTINEKVIENTEAVKLNNIVIENDNEKC